MGKVINFEYKGEKYTLEFNRETVKWLEDQDFKASDITNKPTTMIPLLVYGAFRKNHPGIKRKLVDEIYESIDGKDDFLLALVEMHQEPVGTLFDEGNVKWGKNW